MNLNQTPVKDYFRRLPKIELHRHLEGSLRISTLAQIARLHGMDPSGTGQLRTLVQIGQNEPYTFNNFLSKFATLRLFYKSPDVIGRITHEAIADAAADNIRYMELRFTPVALGRVEGFPLAEVMDWVLDATRQAGEEFPIKTRLIASVNRHEPVQLAEQVVQLAADRLSRGIVGIDLAGNEADFHAAPFVPLFKDARKAGLHVVVHAGEWNGAHNVAEAIQEIGAERIGHGIRVMEDPAVVALARETGVPFEVCITSNYQSGVVKLLPDHPIKRMADAGLNVTINTDDPSISAITLSEEFWTAHHKLGFSTQELHNFIIRAAQASFLPDHERIELIAALASDFPAS